MSYDTLARENIFKNGTLRLLFQAALKPDSRLTDIPFAADLAKTEREHQALDLFLARTSLGRPFIAPPGVPANRTKMLQSAFAQTIANPPSIQEAEAAGLHPLYIAPDDLQSIVAQAYKAPPEIVALTKKAMGH